MAASLRPSLSLQLTSLSDRYVSHFETEGPHVLLYFDSVSREVAGVGHWGEEGHCRGPRAQGGRTRGRPCWQGRGQSAGGAESEPVLKPTVFNLRVALWSFSRAVLERRPFFRK